MKTPLLLLFLFQGVFAIRDTLLSPLRDVIPNQYIVVFDDRADKLLTRKRLFRAKQRLKLLNEYRRGIVVTGLSEEEAELWAQDPDVVSIVPVSCCSSRTSNVRNRNLSDPHTSLPPFA